MNMGKTNFESYSELILSAELNQNIDESVNAYKKLKECRGCGKNFNSTKLFNEHIRLGQDCSIYYKIDYLTFKTCPNQGRNTPLGTYKDLETLRISSPSESK